MNLNSLSWGCIYILLFNPLTSSRLYGVVLPTSVSEWTDNKRWTYSNEFAGLASCFRSNVVGWLLLFIKSVEQFVYQNSHIFCQKFNHTSCKIFALLTPKKYFRQIILASLFVIAHTAGQGKLVFYADSLE